MQNIDSDALDQIGKMMGQDQAKMNQVKQMMKNPEAMKQVKKMLNNSLPAEMKQQLNINNDPKKNNDKVGRNEVCSCGSGKKYKKCCLDK